MKTRKQKKRARNAERRNEKKKNCGAQGSDTRKSIQQPRSEGKLDILTQVHNGLRIEGQGESTVSGGHLINRDSWIFFAVASCKGCGSVMRAPLPSGTKYSRQLYVNGVRANWTQQLFPLEGAAITATGYSVPGLNFRNWKHNGGHPDFSPS